MNVGLVGHGTDDPNGAICNRLFTSLPFAKWLMVKHPTLGVGDWEDAWDSKRLTFMGNCCRVAPNWIIGLDVVVAVHRTWPDNLFQWVKQINKRTVLVAGEDSVGLHHYWYKFADLLIATTDSCYDRLVASGQEHRSTLVPYPPGNDMAARGAHDAMWAAILGG
jgi:hypothetical protein